MPTSEAEMTTTTAKKATPTTPKVTFDPKSLSEQFIAGVKQSNQAALEAVTAWVDTMSGFAAQLPAAPAVPVVAIPGVPTPAEQREAALASFDFVTELVSVQKDFAASYFAALAPLAPKA